MQQIECVSVYPQQRYSRLEPKLVALKLFLDALGIPADIDTVEDRKRVQKAVYLGQISGPNLGYRFNWYHMGPYSPALTRDYYELAGELENDPEAVRDKSLRESALQRLRETADLLKPPPTVPLDQPDWLELLASYHFLRQISHYSRAKAIALLTEQKAHVADYVASAEAALRAARLLN